MLLHIHPDNPDPRQIKKIVECLKDGGVIIYPTDTVYALGCDVYHKKAMEKLCQIKGVDIQKHNLSFVVTASHILFKPSQFDEDAAKAKLTEMKAEIGDDPEKFAAAAKEWSGCQSAKDGGSLGEFGPGMMVKNFDDVCFN